MLRNRAVLARDLGGSKFIAGLVSADGNLIDSRFDRWTVHSEEGILEQLLTAASQLIDANPRPPPLAVGATVPGLTDSVGGIWLDSVFLGIRDFPFADRLSRALSIPAAIENDVNACALAESYFAHDRKLNDFLWVTVSNGVGGAVFLDGRLYHGARQGAGELGHVVVEEGPSARRCHCGNLGCVEAMASGRGLVSNYLQLAGRSSIEQQGLTAESVAELARAGDDIARQTYHMEGVYLGRAIAAAVNILNPSKVFLGGGVSQSFDLFEPALLQTVRARIYRHANPDLSIDVTGLGYHAALLGAAAIAQIHLKKIIN